MAEKTRTDLLTELLSRLHAGGAYGCWFTAPGERHRWWPVDKPSPIPSGKLNVYFCVNPMKSRKRANNNVAAINCVYADADEPLNAERIADYPSSVSIESSPGKTQEYWLLTEPFMLRSDADRARARSLQARWVHFIGGDPGAKDLARVLRWPGTVNYKDEYGPDFPTVKIIRADFDLLYTIEELEALLPEEPAQSRIIPLSSAAHTVRHISHTLPGREDGRLPYVQAAFESELAALASAPIHHRNKQLNNSALALGQFVGAGELDRSEVERSLYAIAIAIGLTERETKATIRSGLDTGIAQPRIIPESARRERSIERDRDPDPEPIRAKQREPVHLTDLGNATRLVREHGRDIRYCKRLKTWLAWDGRRWKEDDTDELQRRARFTVREMYRAAAELESSEARSALAGWAMKSESRYRLNAMVEVAEAEVPVTVGELDTDPWLLNCDNGTLDLRSGELRDHRREDLITKLIPVAYDPDAACPKWIRFLKDVLPDRDLRLFLQRSVGYSLAGVTSEHCLFFAHGIGNNGKSTFFESIMRLLADYAHKMPTETLMIGRRSPGAAAPDIARLAGARFVVAAEVEQERAVAESLVKDLTGGDTLTARQLYQKYIDFRPSHTIWMYGNHKPVIKGTDEGIWRRVHLVPFSVVLSAEQVDKELPSKLAEELAGILSWAVRGCLKWQESGLQVPEAVNAATSEYRAEQDEIGRFLAECCVERKDAYATKNLLYKEYQQWGGELSKWRFGKRLGERGIQDEKMTGGIRVWRGVGLTSEEEA